jgi:hypothetical protein
MRRIYSNIPILLIFMMGLAALSALPVLAQSDIYVTAQTNKASYILRDTVNVSGAVWQEGVLVQEGLVGIEVDDPNGPIVARTVPVGPIVTHGPTVEILSVIPSDSLGNFQQSFQKNSYASFTAMVRNNNPLSRTALVTISVFDAASTPIGMGAATVTIPAGATYPVRPTIFIDTWVAAGNCMVYANVYTAWPGSGGIPYSAEKSSNFTIIDSEYEDPPNNPLPQYQVQNGTFYMTFQLGPEPLPGTYHVGIMAISQGFSSPKALTFDVLDVAAPPRAFFVAKPPIAGANWSILFVASSSTAEGYGDSIKNYTWNFGDGNTTTVTSSNIRHTYPTLGNRTVTLNVTDSENLWNTTSKNVAIMSIHDVAVLDVQFMETVYDEWLVYVPVTVKNKGTVPETFNITLYVNNTITQVKQVASLGPLTTTVVTFNWSTTGLILRANYTLEVVADTVVNETYTSDNTIQSKPVHVVRLADLNFDGKINLFDAVSLLSVYGIKLGQPGWNVMADLRRDDAITLFDAVTLLSRYGTSY